MSENPYSDQWRREATARAEAIGVKLERLLAEAGLAVPESGPVSLDIAGAVDEAISRAEEHAATSVAMVESGGVYFEVRRVDGVDIGRLAGLRVVLDPSWWSASHER